MRDRMVSIHGAYEQKDWRGVNKTVAERLLTHCYKHDVHVPTLFSLKVSKAH